MKNADIKDENNNILLKQRHTANRWKHVSNYIYSRNLNGQSKINSMSVRQNYFLCMIKERVRITHLKHKLLLTASHISRTRFKDIITIKSSYTLC